MGSWKSFLLSDDVLQVRKNTGSYLTARQKINFIEGTGVTLTVADDTSEIDVTIAIGQAVATASTPTFAKLTVDNLQLDANTLSSTSGALNLTPVAGSAVVIDSHFSFDGTTMTAITNNNTTFTAYAGKNITIESVAIDGGQVTGITSLGLTGTRVTAGFFTDLTVTNAISGSITGNAATVTTATSITNSTFYPVFTATADGSAVLLTNSGQLTFNPFSGNLTATVISAVSGISPTVNDGAALGYAATSFSDLFLAEGGVINWDNGDFTITQTGNTLSFDGGNLVQIVGTTSDTLLQLKVGGLAESATNMAGLWMGGAGSALIRYKGALVYEPLGTSWGWGKLHLLLASGANNNDAVLSDAKVTILNSGYVGIGTTAPSGMFSVANANGQEVFIHYLTELTTIAAAATTDTTIQIPANTIVLGVDVRVTVAIPTATTFTVKGTTSGTVFNTGTSVSTAANTTNKGNLNCPYNNVTAQTIRFTPNSTPANNNGRVRCTIHYIDITPATS